MKFLLVIISISCFSFGVSERRMDEDASREIDSCQDHLKNEDYVNKCIDLYCKCFYSCTETRRDDGSSGLTETRSDTETRRDDKAFDLKCVLENGCVEGDISTMEECMNCIEDQPDESKYCNGTAVPSSNPSSSPVPSISLLPSVSPSKSPSPTLSSAPSVECTCLDCNHTSGCNPGKS